MNCTKRAGIVAGCVLTTLLLVSMYATEITRAFVDHTVAEPIPLPAGVDIRYSDRLVAWIGRGVSSGNARAVTLGNVILVPVRYKTLPASEQRRLISHELVHVSQRRTYGRFYLGLYGVLYVVHGYRDHPFEREAYRRVAQ